jgi:hypothetical protein
MRILQIMPAPEGYSVVAAYDAGVVPGTGDDNPSDEFTLGAWPVLALALVDYGDGHTKIEPVTFNYRSFDVFSEYAEVFVGMLEPGETIEDRKDEFLDEARINARINAELDAKEVMRETFDGLRLVEPPDDGADPLEWYGNDEPR